jgi:tetratricopeptide (TPR) repeat protein
MTEDLITDLSKNPGLFVIARNSSFAYKGQKVKVHQLAEELGVRYVLEGSVRRVADELRINAQLIDATTGGHLWAERYDGTLADVFDLQDKVTERIVAALALKLTPHEAGSMRGPGTDNVAAHDAYLLGLSHYYRSTPTDNAKARDHFEQAVELDPNYSAAYTALAKVYLKVRGEAAYSEKLGIYWMAGYTRARRLLEKGMARPNADSHVLLSWFALRKRQHDRAIDEANRALELSPNSSDALEALAEALIYSGQPTEGIEVAERAMRQNPALPGRPLYLVGLAEFTLGVPQNAVKHLERALRHAPNQTHYADILAASYAELSNLQHAEAAFEILAQGLHYEERADLVRLVASHPISSLRVLDRLADGLRVAGARSGFGGYLPLSATNRLSGDDIRSLLFGRKIKGTQLTWQASEFDWRQQRTADGGVEHFGFPVQPGVFSGATGTGRIEDDMLCERWPELSDILDICVVIYRIPEGNAKILWGDYVMFTDLGPQPFRLVE